MDRKEYNKEYYKKNKAKLLEYSAKWKSENKEELAKYQLAYYHKNKAKIKEYRHQYYEKNKEKIQQQQRDLMRTHRQTYGDLRIRAFYKIIEQKRQEIEQQKAIRDQKIKELAKLSIFQGV